MSVLMTKDRKEIIITCNCGCRESVNIKIDDEDKDSGHYAYVCYLKNDFYTEQKLGPWQGLKIKITKIWRILRGKDYCYSDTIMTKDDFEEFKRYINQF